MSTFPLGSDRQRMHIKFQRNPLFAGEFNLFPLGTINCPYPEAKGEDGRVLKVSQKCLESIWQSATSHPQIQRSKIHAPFS